MNFMLSLYVKTLQTFYKREIWHCIYDLLNPSCFRQPVLGCRKFFYPANRFIYFI